MSSGKRLKTGAGQNVGTPKTGKRSNNPYSGKEKPPEKAAEDILGVKIDGKQVVLGPARRVSALDFLSAVVNANIDELIALGFDRVPTPKTRMQCAMAILPYTTRRQPVQVIHEQKPTTWSQGIEDAESRVKNLRKEIEGHVAQKG